MKSVALLEISKVLIEVGKEVEGEKILEESLEVAKSISDESKKSEATVEISKVLIEVGKEGEGEVVLEESLEVAKSISQDLEIESIIEYFKSIDRGRKRGKIIRSRQIYK